MTKLLEEIKGPCKKLVWETRGINVAISRNGEARKPSSH